MTTFLVRMYSPYTLKTFGIRVEASTVEEAERKIVGKTVTDPDGFSFEVEEDFIVNVAPVKTVSAPPYELLPEEQLKAEWLKGARPLQPLPKGATPVGSPTLASTVSNNVTTMLYHQEVRSKCIRFLEHHPQIKVGVHVYGPYKPGDEECNLPLSVCERLTAVKFRVLKSPPLNPLVTPKGKVLREPLTGEAFAEAKAELDRLFKTGQISKAKFAEKFEELKGEYTFSAPEELRWAKLQAAKGNLQQVTTPIAEWVYPEVKVTIQYRRDVFTRFYEEAKRMSKTNIENAVLYLIEHAPGVTVRQIADILGIGYWTAFRAVKALASPEAAKQIEKEAEQQATLERWMPASLEQVKKQPPAKEPKVTLGPLWRGQITLYPVKWKTEEELLNELKRISTLKRYPTLTPKEEAELRRQLHEYWQRKQREKMLFYLT